MTPVHSHPRYQHFIVICNFRVEVEVAVKALHNRIKQNGLVDRNIRRKFQKEESPQPVSLHEHCILHETWTVRDFVLENFLTIFQNVMPRKVLFAAAGTGVVKHSANFYFSLWYQYFLTHVSDLATIPIEDNDSRDGYQSIPQPDSHPPTVAPTHTAPVKPQLHPRPPSHPPHSMPPHVTVPPPVSSMPPVIPPMARHHLAPPPVQTNINLRPLPQQAPLPTRLPPPPVSMSGPQARYIPPPHAANSVVAPPTLRPIPPTRPPPGYTVPPPQQFRGPPPPGEPFSISISCFTIITRVVCTKQCCTDSLFEKVTRSWSPCLSGYYWAGSLYSYGL